MCLSRCAETPILKLAEQVLHRREGLLRAECKLSFLYVGDDISVKRKKVGGGSQILWIGSVRFTSPHSAIQPPRQQLNRHFIRIVSEKGTRRNYGGSAPRLGLIPPSSHQNERRCSIGGQEGDERFDAALCSFKTLFKMKK